MHDGYIRKADLPASLFVSVRTEYRVHFYNYSNARSYIHTYNLLYTYKSGNLALYG